MDIFFFFFSPNSAVALRALALLQPERFPAPGSAPGSCHWHKPFITIMMTFHLFRNDFSFIQDISLPVPTASSTSDTFQSSAGYKSFGLIFFFFKEFSKYKAFSLPPQGAGGFPSTTRALSITSDCDPGGSGARQRDPREAERDAGHSLAGRVHLGRVEQVDAALVGDGHQLLSHLGEAETER